MDKLSAPQQAIYDFMKDFQSEKGYPPSVREIGCAVGLRSTSTVHGHLTRLERKGLLRRDPSKPRAIEIVELQKHRNCVQTVPVFASLKSGVSIIDQKDIEGYVSISQEFAKGENLFVLNIKGSSMINAGILNNDQIIVQPNTYIKNGDIVVAMLHEPSSNESFPSVKRFFKENSLVRLQPENPAMEPLFVSNVEIVGKVIGLMRKI